MGLTVECQAQCLGHLPTGVFDRLGELADDDVEQIHRLDLDPVLVVGVVRDEDAGAVVLALQGVNDLLDGDGLGHSGSNVSGGD